jgi:hypothetical protein
MERSKVLTLSGIGAGIVLAAGIWISRSPAPTDESPSAEASTAQPADEVPPSENRSRRSRKKEVTPVGSVVAPNAGGQEELSEEPERQLTPEERAEREEKIVQRGKIWLAEMTKSLKLEREQVAQVEEISKEYMEKMRKFRNPEQGDPPDRAARHKYGDQLRTELEKRLATVLDKSQMVAYQKLDMRQRLGGGGRRQRRDRDVR